MSSEVRRYNEEDYDPSPSQSLWSCIKNSVRRKKCTCHLVMGRLLKMKMTLYFQFFVVTCVGVIILSSAASDQFPDQVQQISAFVIIKVFASLS